MKTSILDAVCEPRIEMCDPRRAPETEFSYIDISSVDNVAKRIVSPSRINGAVAPSRARQRVRTGDVLVATTRPNLNAVALVGSELDGQIASTGFCVLRPKSESLSPEFLYLWVRHPSFVESLSSLVQGALYPAVSDRQVREQAIPLPPLARQREIVTRLDAQLDATTRARTAVRAQLADAEQVIQRWIDDKFAAIAEHRVATRRLDTAAEIQAGVTLGKDYPPSETVSVPYLRVANVKDGRLDLADVKSIAVPPQISEKLALRFGDMLLTEGGDPDKVGRGTLWQNELPKCIHQNHIFRVRFDLTQFDPTFLALQFRCAYAKAYFLAHAKQTTGIASINQQVLRAYPLLHVAIIEQRAMVAAYMKLNEQSARALTALSQQVTDLDRLPAALLREAFAG
jgi:type I restriction enzyme S subunit